MNAKKTTIANAEVHSNCSEKRPCRAPPKSTLARGAQKVRCLDVSKALIEGDIKREAIARPLCRNYWLVLIQTLSAPSHEKGRVCHCRVAWALGVVADGKYESLGVWTGEGDDAVTRQAILADLRLRGVEQIAYVLGPGVSDAAPPVPSRTVLASHEVADELQRLASQAVRRHGPFESTADAVSFVTAALRRAEERLGDISVDEAVAQLAGRVGCRASERSGAIPWLAR